MKKYTIKDNLGNKKTIYADNLSHAIKLNDNKIQDIDASSLMALFSKYGKPYGYACKTKPRMSSSASKYLGQLASYTLSPIGKYDTNKARDFVNFLNKKGYEAAIFAPDIIVTVKQDRSSGLYHSGHERTSQYDSEVKDEASLATTINALVNDEKAAIDAYNVAIKNLEGSIDDTARQVLINIRDDERRHIENLYSILNGQVTEKNLEDSIHDAVKSPSAYVNTRLVKNMLPNDLMAEGLKNDYSFNDVLKNFDAISSQILDVVKDALDEAKRDIIDFKRNYINALIN